MNKASAPAADPRQINLQARQAVLDYAINMWQPVAQGTLAGVVPGQVVNVPVRNVGLIKRFVLELNFNVVQGAAETQTQTPLGIANTISQFVFTDLSNQTRVNTTGWHMHLLATARRQMAFGAAFTNDSPVALGNNFGVIKAPASVTTTQPCRMFYEIPIAYSDYDLRGSIFANVVNATMNLQFVVNPNFFLATGADPTLGAYRSSTAQLGNITNFSYTLYQNYLDQLPVGKNGVILPQLDMSTAYLLNNSVVTGLAVNQDNPIPYANFRDFYSTMAIYDNGGLNAGTDINNWSIQSANYTNIMKLDPFMASLLTREIISDDFPPGAYYFDHRAKPISTIQYGNMQLIANLSSVAGGTSQILVAYEAMAMINMITQAGSLYGT
jgi:hypothetical protein